MPKVSIVLPTYNGEKYIRESIESILKQSFKDYELIIVNDHSTDCTGDILEEYKEKDGRIKVVTNEINQKLPASLNIGFELASGEYFTWTSDDNLYKETAIEQMVAYLDENKDIPMVRADMHIIDENSNIVKASESFTNQKMFINNYVGACFLYRKTVAKKVGGYDTELFCVEDYDYWIRVMKEAGLIGNIETTLYCYRCHGESLSATKKSMVESQLQKMRKKYVDFFIEHMQEDIKSQIALYAMLLDCGFNREETKQHIRLQCELIEYDGVFDRTKETIVYGAGDYGNRVYEMLGGKVAFFIDKNKAGSELNGIPIKSLSSCMNELKQYNLVIGVSSEKNFEILTELIGENVRKYITFSSFRQQICKVERNNESDNDKMLSVIVPVYNVEEYLPQCLESVCVQAGNEIEIIIIDDGSTDHSKDICDEFKEKYPEVKVIHKKNGGLVSARKEGLFCAKGKYITFVDGDDWIDSDWYQKLLIAIKDYHADIISYGCMEEYDGFNRPLINHAAVGFYAGDKLELLKRHAIIKEDEYVLWQILPHLWNKLIKRDLLADKLNKVDNEITYGEDAACVFPCIWDSESILLLEDMPYHYRQRNDSMSKCYQEIENNSFEKIRYCLENTNYTNDFVKEEIDLYMYFLYFVRQYSKVANKNMVLFPFPEIREKDSVVIYGAGGFGKSIYVYNQKNECVNIVGVVDRKGEQCSNEMFSVQKVETICEMEYKYIVIAILNESVCRQIKEQLVQTGIEPNKILYITKNKMRKVNEENEEDSCF